MSRTIDGFQLVIPEDESEEFGPGGEAQHRCPLEAVIAQVQMLQLTGGLCGKRGRPGKQREREREGGEDGENEEGSGRGKKTLRF